MPITSVKKVTRMLSSLKLAVLVIVALAVIIATGTIIESRYNAQVAQAWVYRSVWMYFTLGFLACNLLAVMIDRWPWKKKHTPFILAHIGILVLLAGAFWSMNAGVDGTMLVPVGGKSQFVSLPETELTVWSSFDGERYARMYGAPFSLWQKPPYPTFLTDAGPIDVQEIVPFATTRKEITALENLTDQKLSGGAAIRIQIQNAMATTSEWLYRNKISERVQLKRGPLTITWLPENVNLAHEEELLKNAEATLLLQRSSSKTFRASAFSALHHRWTRGVLKMHQKFQTGLMNSEITLLDDVPHAREEIIVEKLDHPTEMSTAALRLRFREKDSWIEQNDIVKFFTPGAVFIVSFAQKKFDVGFPLALQKFNLENYAGTDRPASYESEVQLPDQSEQKITMNEPLKLNGFTFYQASFQQDDTGHVIASVFSVNRDPGRPLKYLGSLILSLGVILLFYQKRRLSAQQLKHKI